MWMKFRKHCSDEQLLAALDGELPEVQRKDAVRHLAACWACRTRQAEIEAQVHRLTRAAAQSPYPEGGWSTRARRRFTSAVQALEPASAAQPHPPARRWAWAAAAGVAAAAALVVYSAGWLRPPEPAPVRAGLEQLIQSDRGIIAAPVHQVLRVQIEQTRPRVESRARQLEVWSDPENGRHALHWRDQGVLRQAAWRSAAGGAGVSPAFAGAPAQTRDLVAAVGGHWSAGEMEEAFLRWLAARVWEPVTLSSDFSVFASDFGTKLVAEQVEPGLVRLTATRQRAQVVTEWVVELDEHTHRPRLQRIRWERPDTAMEIRFVVETEARLDAAALRPAVFHSPFPPKPPAPSALLDAPPEALRTDPVMPARKVELATAGIQAEYALRRMPREWVEAVEVEFEDSAVAVRGVTQTAEMREAIEAVLGRLEWVKVDVKSVEEASADAPSAAAEVSWIEPAHQPRFPLEKELAERFAVAGDKPETARRVAEFSAKAARLAAGVLGESWALERLAVRYPEERLALVRPETRWLLDELRERHLRALNQARAELRELVAPVLAPLARARNRPGTSAPPAAGTISEADLLRTAAEVDRLIRGLLAGAPLDDIPAREGAGRLLDALERLEPETVRVRTAWQAGPGI
jgi:hypothetical protein